MVIVVNELYEGVAVIDTDNPTGLTIAVRENDPSKKFEVWMKSKDTGDAKIKMIVNRSKIENMMKILQGVLDKSAGEV